MILFLEDWLKPEHAGAIVDTQTKNQSFIDLANLLKSMGIQNYYFFLALHDRTLQGVDPFDENLTEAQITRITKECQNNPWYFFREIISAPTTGKRVPFRANRANISMIWSFFNHCQYLLIQPRQTGKSFSTDCLMTYLLFIKEGLRIMLYTKSSDLRVENIRRLRAIQDKLPYYLNFLTRNDSQNQETITVSKRSNRYLTTVCQADPEAADKIGRGNTIEIRHADEIAYCKNNHITLPVMGSAMNAAIADAKRDGKPYGSIFTTTAGKKDTPHGKYAYEIFVESAEWKESFYDAKNHSDFERKVRDDSNPLEALAKANGVFAIQGTFSHRQLGYTDEWLVNSMVQNKVYGEAALRDYFNVWTSGTETSPFSTKQTETISNSEKEPVYREIGENGLTLKWYYPEHQINSIMNTRPVIMGMDTSNNIGRDSSTITIVDATTLEVIGAGNYNNLSLVTYSKWVGELLLRYPKMLLVVENKLSAQGIVDHLIEVLTFKGMDPFKRIFNVVVNEKEYNPRRFQTMDANPNRAMSANSYRPYFGYTTSGTGRYSRDNLYRETLYRAVDIAASKIHDKKLINEMVSLVIKNDRIDHQEGKHDDQVISWLLACWFIFNGRNTHYYDIVKVRFLSNVTESGESLTPEQLFKQREQESIKEKITSLYNELSQAEDYFEFNKLEKEIRLLESRLDARGQMSLSINEMINDLKEKRQTEIIRSSPTLYNDLVRGLDDIHEEMKATNNRPMYFTSTNKGSTAYTRDGFTASEIMSLW